MKIDASSRPDPSLDADIVLGLERRLPEFFAVGDIGDLYSQIFSGKRLTGDIDYLFNKIQQLPDEMRPQLSSNELLTALLSSHLDLGFAERMKITAEALESEGLRYLSGLKVDLDSPHLDSRVSSMLRERVRGVGDLRSAEIKQFSAGTPLSVLLSVYGTYGEVMPFAEARDGKLMSDLQQIALIDRTASSDWSAVRREEAQSSRHVLSELTFALLSAGQS